MEIDSEPPSSLHEQVLRLAGLEVAESEVSSELTALLRQCALDLPRDVKERLYPYIWLEASEFIIDDCHFSMAIENLEMLDKSSASHSWVLFGLLLGRDVAIKLSVVMRTTAVAEYYYALETERNIYRHVVNSLLICGLTPHVLAYYATLSCDEFFANIFLERNPHMQRLYQLLQSDALNQHYDGRLVRAVVTERAHGRLLLHVLPDLGPSESDFNVYVAPLLFQLFFTLQVFGEIGLMHNDLHAGNVFVHDTDEPTINYYRVGDDVFRIVGTLQTRVFDFDRSVKLPTTFDTTRVVNRGIAVRYCAEYGQCNVLNQRAELYPLVVSLYMATGGSNAALNDFLTDVVPADLLLRPTHEESTATHGEQSALVGSTLAFPGRLCACNQAECRTCTLLDDDRILLPLQVLAKQQFLQFRVDPLAVPPEAFVWQLPSSSATHNSV